DPAARLAAALGVAELGNEPERVEPSRLAGHGAEPAGELWAMTLDPKRTFDDLIARLSPDERTREEVLRNRVYQGLSGAVAGSQEYTAMAKLYDLHRDGRFDAIVLDTPPSRNALDFLDAPDRLIRFLEGRALRALLTPTGLAARIAARGAGAVLGTLRPLTGPGLLEDLATFFRALGGLLDGFRARAAAVKALLESPSTAFVVVASPEREPVEEAIFLRRELARAGLPFGGLVVNRVHDPVEDERAPAELHDDPGLAARVALAAAELGVLARRDAAAVQRLRAQVDPGAVVVPELEGDVHDVDGLAAVCRHLLG
ncbi:MAG TPA: ArsA-related P-loop ATPase, partial [Solirubrobacteraceae bacterium]|nr:ArsA-related P-loop ATPase [Solirubrobacteraceae bacterium]